MDEQAKFPPELIRKLFDLGVMAIEVPEQFGGAGATFFHSVLAVEALARVDASVGVLVDVQNTLVINAMRALGQRRRAARDFCRSLRAAPSAPTPCRKLVRAATPSRCRRARSSQAMPSC